MLATLPVHYFDFYYLYYLDTTHTVCVCVCACVRMRACARVCVSQREIALKV